MSFVGKLAFGFSIPVAVGLYYFGNKKNIKSKEFCKTDISKENIELTIPEYCSVLNLTPDAVILFDSNNNKLFSIKPASKEFQLRLVSTEEKSNKEKLCTLVSYDYDYEFHERSKISDINGIRTWNYGDGDQIETKFPLTLPTVYNKVEGVDQLREERKQFFGHYPYGSIIVSTIVAEYLMNHKEEFNDLNMNVLVPDTDPSKVVKDEKGAILGVKGFIYYGQLKSVTP